MRDHLPLHVRHLCRTILCKPLAPELEDHQSAVLIEAEKVNSSGRTCDGAHAPSLSEKASTVPTASYTNPLSTSWLPPAVISCRCPDPPTTRDQLSETSLA